MHNILIGSTNKGKIIELTLLIQESLGNDVTLLSLNDFDPIPEPDEPFETFLENATHKARYYGDAFNVMCITDDSGLCVDALNGFPGVHTKEFWHDECGSLPAAYVRLAEMLKDTDNKRVHYQAAIVLYLPEKNVVFSRENSEHGTLRFPATTGEGFGFDPVFVPDGYDRTLSELGVTVKNSLSHRGKATRELIADYLTFKQHN